MFSSLFSTRESKLGRNVIIMMIVVMIVILKLVAPKAGFIIIWARKVIESSYTGHIFDMIN